MQVLPHILFLIACVKYAESAEILGVFAFASRSHYILGNALMRGLAEAGHDVTMISPHEEQNPPKNGSYTNVVLTGFVEEFEALQKEMNLFEMNRKVSLGTHLTMLEKTTTITKKTLQHRNLQELIKSNKKFDVIIIEQFMNDALKVLGDIFDAPVVLFSSVGANPSVNQAVGNPYPSSYIPFMMASFPPNMTFLQRSLNALLNLFGEAVNNVYTFPMQRKLLQEIFPDAPDLNELYYNTSLVLLNSHISTDQPVPLVPNMVEIGGYHIKPPKKLPKELQEFLDNAKEGVVYFSMGSNLKSKDLPENKREALLNTFKKLKQKVLWKWEDEKLPGQPPNVMLQKWMPQQDILAHPNVKLFITHGGLLSITETIYHGVPILAIPVFADQHKNANQAVLGGYGLALPYHDDDNFTEDKLTEFIQRLVDNPTYKNNVKARSTVFHDRPLKPMENAVFWVEYIIRHKGAPHLRVAGVGMPWYKYYLIDVLCVIFLLLTLIVVVVYVSVKKIICRKKKQTTVKKDKKKLKKN